MKIAAVIPTLGERVELQPLIKQLVAEGVDVLSFGLPGENLHHIWNEGVHLARDWRKAEAIAILNDDIRLPRNTLAVMYEVMRASGAACIGVDRRAPFGLPKSPTINFTSGSVERLMEQVTTWCFMVRADAWQDIDERYQWWWGVGDLFVKIQDAGGKLGQVDGLGIEHVGSGTAKNHHWTKAAQLRDAKLWRSLH